MACSPECYQKYMRRIEMARNKPMESIKNDILESISEEAAAAVKPKTRKKKAENIEDTDEN